MRQNIDISATKLNEKIDEIKGNGEVIIIAHSMGGVVANAWLSQNLQANVSKIEKIFYIGSPVYGAPKMLMPLMFGKENPVLHIPIAGPSEPQFKAYIRNMPGIYSLLPGNSYGQVAEMKNYYFYNGVARNFQGYENAKLKLNPEILSRVLMRQAEIINEITHSVDGKRQFIPPLRNKAYFVYGYNLETITSVYGKNAVFEKRTIPPTGDGTVPRFGLEDLVEPNNCKKIKGHSVSYPPKNDPAEHLQLAQNPSVLNWIKDKIG